MFLGIELGSTRIKAVIIGGDGVASASRWRRRLPRLQGIRAALLTENVFKSRVSKELL